MVVDSRFTQIPVILAIIFSLSLSLSHLFNISYAHQSPASPDHSCSHGHHDHTHESPKTKLLPEELAEEEDLKLFGFGSGSGSDHHHHHEDDDGSRSNLTGAGLWIYAMGCSLLVSLASLICLTIIPILCAHGKPSKAVVDSLALFGAGPMLGDAFLHQLPHAFSGGHSHEHDHSETSHSHSSLMGQDPGQSSLIEGFTAGGFIYISVAGVLAEMNNNGSSSLKSSVSQLSSLVLGMAIALGISLVE